VVGEKVALDGEKWRTWRDYPIVKREKVNSEKDRSEIRIERLQEVGTCSRPGISEHHPRSEFKKV